VTSPTPGHWFSTTDAGLVKPCSWQGRLAYRLYLVLVVFAVVIYSSWGLVLTVVAIYTLVLAAIIFVKSDLADRLRDRRDRP
jgi:hypothetical protein